MERRLSEIVVSVTILSGLDQEEEKKKEWRGERGWRGKGAQNSAGRTRASECVCVCVCVCV